jgi:Fe-S cluster assembly scaffold protein SufB
MSEINKNSVATYFEKTINEGWENWVFKAGFNDKIVLKNSLNLNKKIVVEEGANVELVDYIFDINQSNEVQYVVEVSGNLKLHHVFLCKILQNKLSVTSSVFGMGNYTNTVVDLNRGNSLINLESNIVEEGGKTSVLTASISGENYVKNLVVNNINHAPHSEAYMTNFGIGYDEGKLVVDGLGDIRNGAHGSVNKQHSTMIVFDELAKATNKPLLLIEEDDVVANHASAVGKIDEQTIFYLCSRGLTPKQAKKYISLGYFKPVLAYLSDEEIKESVLDYLEEVIKDD